MNTKKATKKKTGKALAKQGGGKGQFSGGLLANSYVRGPLDPQTLSEALKTFDAALTKVVDLRAVLTGAVVSVGSEVTAHRAQRLANITSELSMAAHTLNAAAYHEAAK